MHLPLHARGEGIIAIIGAAFQFAATQRNEDRQGRAGGREGEGGWEGEGGGGATRAQQG